MSQQRLINIFGEELKTNFFVFVSEKTSIDHKQLCLLWDQYFNDGASIEISLESPKEKTRTSPKEKAQTSPKEKTKKTTLPKEKPGCLQRSDQTAINFNDIDKLKVADLKKYNKERGIPITGTKADLSEYLKEYEKKYHSDEECESEVAENPKPRGKYRMIGVSDPKQKKTKTTKPVISMNTTEIEVTIDDYNNQIIDEDLVVDEENGELIVIGLKNEEGNVVKLTHENVDRCKALNVKFNPDNVELRY